jgi:hypothetical protein
MTTASARTTPKDQGAELVKTRLEGGSPGREHTGVANDWERLREYLPNLFVDFPGWHVRPRITNKSVPIGHFDARQRRFVQLRFFVDNSVQVQNERRNRIGLVGRKTSWSRIWHRAMYVIPDGRRIRPVAAHRPHRVLAPQRALASNERWILRYSLAAISVAIRAEHLIVLLSLRDGAASHGQASAVRGHRDVALAKFFCGRWPSEFVAGSLRNCGGDYSDRRTEHAEPSLVHGSPSHLGARTTP